MVQRGKGRGASSAEKIKDALLACMSAERFHKIGVAEVCRRAGVSRTTFYTHYANLSLVLDDLIDDCFTGAGPGAIALLGITFEGEQGGAYPLCQRVRNPGKYAPLMDDDALVVRIIEHLISIYEDRFVENLVEHERIKPEQARVILAYQMSGCFMTARLARCDDAEWERRRTTTDCFLACGMRGIGRLNDYLA